MTVSLSLCSDYVTGWTTQESGFDSRWRQLIFLLFITTRPALGAVSRRIKRPGREADRSLQSTAEAKNGGARPPLPMRFQGLVVSLLSPRAVLHFCLYLYF
jgi:hypothetical protein